MGLRQRAISGAFWVAGGTYFNQLTNFVCQIWLMRLLAPDLFGVVALAMFFMLLTKKLFGFGFNHALIHRQDDLERVIPAHLFMHLAASALSLLIILAIAPLISTGYSDQLVAVLLALACFSVFEDLSNTPRILLEKGLAFSKLMALSSANVLITSVIAVTIAYLGGGIWAIVARYGVNVVIGCIGYWALSPVKFRLRIDREIIAWFLRFGGYLWINGLATFAILELDDFLVGTMVGMAALGFYSRAYRFASLPTDAIGHVVSRVAFPLYSKLQKDRRRLSQVFQMTMRGIFIACLPLAVLTALVARPFTLLLVGPTWEPMIPLLQLLVIYAALRPLLGTTGELLVAVGQPRIIGRITIAQTLVLLALCPVAIMFWAAEGAALAVGLVMAVGVLLAFFRIGKFVDIAWGRIFIRPLIATLIAAGLTLPIVNGLAPGSLILDLALRCLLFGGSYPAIIYLLDRDSLKEELGFLLGKSPE